MCLIFFFSTGDINSLNKKRESKYAELEKRLEREKQLRVALQKLQIKRNLMNKKDEIKKRVKRGTKDAPPIYLWKHERKRWFCFLFLYTSCIKLF